MYLKTTILILIITNLFYKSHCDETNYQIDEIRTDQLLEESENKTINDDNPTQNKEIEENDTLEDMEAQTTTEGVTTVTEPEIFRSQEDSSENVETTVTQDDSTDANDEITMSIIDNNVYIKDVDGHSNFTNVDTQTKSNTLPMQSTTRAMDEEPVASIEQEQNDIPGQRSPKTEDDTNQPPEKWTYVIKPRPPALNKSSTLKGWLEDSWVRPPAGILVPLRPMALNRALAVWNDLAAGGLNISDIVIVGYDSNGVNWRSRHNLQQTNTGNSDRAVSEALSKLLLKYQGVHTDSTNDGTMQALTSAAKLVPYDSALFVVTDKRPGDPQRLPLALRALVEKRLKVYTIWTDPTHPSTDSEEALQEMRNISKHTEGEVLPYSLQVMDVESASNFATEAELEPWMPLDTRQGRRGRLNSAVDVERFETLLVRRGGGQVISFGLPIENGVSALRILIEGAVEHAVLYPPNVAPQIDLYNATSVSAFSPASKIESTTPHDVYLVFPGVEFNEDRLAVLPANPSVPETPPGLVGMWYLSVRCDTCDYRICVVARANIHFDVETILPDTLKFRVTGPVSSIRESQLVDEYGNELAKLPFSSQPMSVEGRDEDADPLVELISDVVIPPIKGSKVYVKIVGRDTKGEPFVRLAGPLDQPEVRTGRSAAIMLPDSMNDLEMAEELNSWLYNELMTNNSSSVPYSRITSQVINQQGTLLTAVQIGLSTRLYGSPGDSLQLHFEVTNYREQSVPFRFGAVGELKFLTGINPSSQTILSGQTVNVIVSVTIPASTPVGSRDTITFTAYGNEQISISAYVYVANPGETTTDVWAPEVRHTFQGTCLGRTGSDCAQHAWSTTIIARDAQGGLLRLSSSPIGLMYDSDFISGSRNEVTATYRATCCAPRILVTAVDAYGNANSYYIDISYYLNGATIAAIVLGVLLAIALLSLLIFLIYWCVKRRQETRDLSSYNSRNMS